MLRPHRVGLPGVCRVALLSSGPPRASIKEAPVSQKILQVNYKFGIPAADLSRALLPAAQPIADSPGLQWKIWLMNETDSEAGGIYLFEDDAAVNAFLGGPIVSALKANPAVSDIRVKMFDVSEAHSIVTRGPIGAGTVAGSGMGR